MTDYHINVFYSDAGGGYIADLPDLKHCSAFGETPEEAVHAVQRAKSAWIESARADSEPVPVPVTVRPFISWYEAGARLS